MITSLAELKKKFKERQFIYGAFIASSDPGIAELFAKILKPDFIGIDMEHSVLSLSDVHNIFLAIKANGCAALPRLSSHDPGAMKRLLDAGASGVIVPTVNNKEELNAIIQAMKYPPVGKRGYGISRAQGYGESFTEYTSSWNESSILIIIIESREGVEHIEELVSHPMVDGVLIGTYDLSGSFNTPGDLTSDKVKEAEKVITECCAKYQKSCGLLIAEVDESTLKEAQKKANFVILSTDRLILAEWSRRARELIAKMS